MEVVRLPGSVSSIWREEQLPSPAFSAHHHHHVFQGQQVSQGRAVLRAALSRYEAGFTTPERVRRVGLAARCLQNGRYLGKSAASEQESAFLPQDEQEVKSDEEEVVLKGLGQNLSKELRGSSIFFVGMMGSGKTTVGKILAEAMGYMFFDTDALIESAAGATVSELFRESEENFRDAETEVLAQLSCMVRLVVATGGGAVIRPNNWAYLRHGVTVWLNVPLKALAERVVAVGTHSRPLLGERVAVSECAFTQAFSRLSAIFQQREGAYQNADVIVNLEDLAREGNYEATSDLTPTMIAIEVARKVLALVKKSKNGRNVLT